jgi:hypothetical protein
VRVLGAVVLVVQDRLCDGTARVRRRLVAPAARHRLV